MKISPKRLENWRELTRTAVSRRLFGSHNTLVPGTPWRSSRLMRRSRRASGAGHRGYAPAWESATYLMARTLTPTLNWPGPGKEAGFSRQWSKICRTRQKADHPGLESLIGFWLTTSELFFWTEGVRAFWKTTREIAPQRMRSLSIDWNFPPMIPFVFGKITKKIWGKALLIQKIWSHKQPRNHARGPFLRLEHAPVATRLLCERAFMCQGQKALKNQRTGQEILLNLVEFFKKKLWNWLIFHSWRKTTQHGSKKT